MISRKLICFMIFLLCILFISGCIDGCIELPTRESILKPTKDAAPGRGVDLSLTFNRERTIKSIEKDEELEIALYITNHGVNDLDVDISIRDDLPEEYGAIDDGGSELIYSNAEREDGKVKSVRARTNEKPFIFGPYVYEEKVNGLKIFAGLEVDNYEVSTSSSIESPSVCVRKSGVNCRSKLSQSDFGWGIRTAPVSIAFIEEIQKSLNVDEDEIMVDLIITFKNYGGEINNEDKQIDYFDINLGGYGFNCKPHEEKEFLSFKKKNEAKIKCTTSVDIGDSDSVSYPLEISFSYPYKITKAFGPIDVV